jgi:hypothetical protein
MRAQTDSSPGKMHVYFRPDRLHTLLSGLIVFLAVFFLLLFLYSAVRRMRYPFDLEWVESGMVMSLRNIVQGRGLYTAPSLDYVPYLYAPLYFYLAAGLSKLTGVSFLTLRLLSVLSTLGSCGLIYAFVLMETRRRLAAVAGTGLFLACYPLTGNFYDIGRVDSLFVFFLLLALFFLRRGHPVLSALAWVLCFQTKQSILPVALVLLCIDWKNPRRTVQGLGTFTIVLGASMFWINHATGGWYTYYLFHIAGGFGILWREVFLFFPNDVLAPMGIVLLFCLAACIFVGVDLRSEAGRFYGAVTFILVGAIGYVAAHAGASSNAYMPVYAWFAVLFGVALHRLLAFLESAPNPQAPLAILLVLTAAAIQLGMFLYNPGRFLPTAEVLQGRQRFIDQLRATPGDVYVYSHPYYAVMAGKGAHAGSESIGAVLYGPPTEVAAKLRVEFEASVHAHRYSAIVIDGPVLFSDRHAIGLFLSEYPYAFSAESEGFRFLTSEPTWILLPCSSAGSVAPFAMREDTDVHAGACRDK